MSEEERKSLIESIVDDILFLEKAETHDAINHCVLSSNEDMPWIFLIQSTPRRVILRASELIPPSRLFRRTGGCFYLSRLLCNR